MFKSKYIFETRRTRAERHLTGFLIVLLVSTIVYTILCLLLVLLSRNETVESRVAFYKKSPDLIVVFTGHRGRIPHALKLSKKYNQPNVFITGVYSKNSVATLLRPFTEKGSYNPDLLRIDYHARNTFENVLSTLRYLEDNRNIKHIVITSHDYHIMRIKLIVNSLFKEDAPYTFHYDAVKTNYFDIRNIKILYKEVFKWVRTLGFLTLWSPLES